VRPEDFDKMDEEGIFWIDFTDCRAYFKSFFLNCVSTLVLPSLTSPLLWQGIHRSSPSGGAHMPSGRSPRDPEWIHTSSERILSTVFEWRAVSRARALLWYSPLCPLSFPSVPVSSTQSSSIWILLTRHITAMADELASESSRNDTFLTLHVHRGGKRLYAPAQPHIKGIYSSDPHILTRIDISAEDTRGASEVSLEHPQGKPIEYTLLLSQNDKKRDVSYTLSVYSTSLPFACRPLPPLPLNQVESLSPSLPPLLILSAGDLRFMDPGHSWR
jgi:hypothetical protein